MNKEEKVTLIDAFKDFKEEKNIDRPVMMGVLKDVFLTQIAKTYGSADNFDVIVNVDKGTCEIYQNFDIVEEVENPAAEMTLEEVRKDSGDDDYEIGDTYAKKLPLSAFGRRGILNIRQNLQGRIMDIEKANVYKKYSEKVGEVFTGEIYQTWSREVLLLDEDGNELHIPKEEQIPGERFKKNDTVRAIIKKVEMRNNTTPYITLSRIDPDFLARLFEMEVPEIADGLITIKKVVRVPGERAKVAVESYDERIDPIGACIGVKGGRVIGIVRELRNENIDVLQWSSNPKLLIQRALTPARVSSIDMGEGPEDKVKVYMLPEEVQKGIGRGGVNVQLAGMLVGREIEVWRETPKGEIAAEEEDDVALEEFTNPEYGRTIDGWVIDKLKSIGCDTARSVLAIDPEDLAKRADLDIETVEDVRSILAAEFED
ncbi:MAG: transcription termination/antitermination protein NusA [Bacteroidales bacterium]|nr:transcription termination/antitermination protein NusA [Bacteroidales bacterium]